MIRSRTIVIAAAIPMIWILFHFLSGGAVLTPGNLINLFKYVTVVGILSAGMTLVIVMGHVDLSVGSGLGMLGAVCAYASYRWGLPFYGAATLGLLVAMAMGGAQGAVIAYLGVPSFIVTLSGLMAFMGAKQLIANPVIPITDPIYLWLGQGYISPGVSYAVALGTLIVYALSLVARSKSAVRYGLRPLPLSSQLVRITGLGVLCFGLTALCNTDRGVPVCVLLMLGVALFFHLLLRKTRFGRYVYAIGSNPEAALYSGIPIPLHTVIVFMISGFTVFLAGMVSTSQLMAGAPDIGDYQELYAIAACVIGGTRLKGGTGNVWMSLLGALLMASVLNGMEQVGIASTIQKIILGLILIIAVAGDQWVRRNSELAR